MGRRVDVQFVAKPSYRACWALLLDASPDGIAMFSAEAVVPGTSIALRIYTPNPDADPMVAAEVGHCTPSASGGWILGCKLRRAFSREELLALVATDVSVLCFKL